MPRSASDVRSTAAHVGRSGQFVLAATVLASAMAFIDGSIVTIALPVVQTELGAQFQQLQWVVNAYTLMLGALILVGGALGDRVGRRRVFVIGIVVFAVASLACAGATGIDMLIGARAVQGIGAALLVPQSLAIIAASFPRDVRGKAIGVWAAASAVTTSLGPPIGGFVIDLWSWRAAFLINLPLSAAALILSFTHVPESSDPSARRLDWLGSTLAIVVLGAFTYGLTLLSGRVAADTRTAEIAFVVAVAGCVAFLIAERRSANPILPDALLRSRPFVVANVVTLFLYGALTGVLFLLPFDLIARRGMAASAVGLTLLPFGLIIGLLSRLSGGLADRFGARNLLVGGSFVAAAASALIALDLSDYWLGVFAPVTLMAFGMAAVVTPLTTVIMNTASDAQSGTASGINNAASRVAGLIAVAGLGGLAGLVFSLNGAPPDARFGELPEVGAPARAALESAFVTAYSTAMFAAAVLAAVAALSAIVGLKKEECSAAPPPQALIPQRGAHG
jgi:EmrB/QacA subfamily drug resistance transporter